MKFNVFIGRVFKSRTFYGWIILLIVSTILLCFDKIDGTMWVAMNSLTFGGFITSNKIGDNQHNGKAN